MRLRTRSLVIMCSRGLTQISSLLLAIILVRLLDKASYGSFRQGLLILTFCSGILLANISDSLFYFLPKAEHGDRRKILMQTFMLSMWVAGIASVALVSLAPQIAMLLGDNHELESAIRVLALHVFADALLVLIPTFMISIDRALIAGLYSVFGAVTRIVVVSAAFWGGLSLTNVFICLTIANSVLGLIGLLHMVWLTPHKASFAFDWTLMRQIIGYTWPLWLNSGMALLNLKLDQLVISSFFDPETFAVYVNGAMELPIVGLMTASIGTAIMPNLVDHVHRGRLDSAIGLWQNGIRKTSLAILPCFAFLLVTAQDFIIVLYGNQYAMAVWPFSVYLFLLPLRVTLYASLFRALGRTQPLVVGSTIALAVNLSLSLALTWLGHQSLLGFIGPSIANVAGCLVWTVYMLIMLGKLTSRSPLRVLPLRNMGRILGLSLVAVIPVLAIRLSALPTHLQLIVQFLAFGVSYLLLLVITRSLTADEQQLLCTPFSRLRKCKSDVFQEEESLP
jgi:O-antigen/teichoic acid export membrane protein